MDPFIIQATTLLVDWGLLDVILPFLFVFTLLFAMLQKSKVLGSTRDKEPKTNFNSLFSFVVSFFFIASLSRVNLLNQVLWKVSIFMVIIICGMLFVGLFGLKSGFELNAWIILPALVIVSAIFLFSLGWFSSKDLEIIFQWIFNPVTIGAMGFILVTWFIIRGAGEGTSIASDKSVKENKSKKDDRLKGVNADAKIESPSNENSEEQMRQMADNVLQQAIQQFPPGKHSIGEVSATINENLNRFGIQFPEEILKQILIQKGYS